MALLAQTAPSHSPTTDKKTHALDYGSTKGSPRPTPTTTPTTATTTPTSNNNKETMVTHRASAAATAAAKLSVEDSDEDDRKTLLDKPGLARTKDLAMTVLERYHNATSTKMYDVEELVDYYFHRRLAAVTAVIISYLPFVITPNQITIFGLGLGWASALCLYDSEFHYPLAWQPTHSLLAASLFMFFWIVSDCADGQVARLCKRGTRTGRILDGVVDGLVIAPNIFIMSMMCANRWGDPYFPISMASGFSLWAHAIIYDKIKNTYMENALPQSECDGETVESVKKEFLEAKAKDPFALDSILLGIYVVYMKVQATLTSDAASKAEATRFVMLAKCNDQYRASYIKKYSYVVRLASFMGISAHVSALYVAYFAAIYVWESLFYVQMYFLVLQNGVMVLSLYLYSTSGMSTQQPLNSAL